MESGDLSVAEQQLIEIANHEPKISPSTMDEPTASSKDEVAAFEWCILKSRGIAVIPITHHLHEISDL